MGFFYFKLQKEIKKKKKKLGNGNVDKVFFIYLLRYVHEPVDSSLKKLIV